MIRTLAVCLLAACSALVAQQAGDKPLKIGKITVQGSFRTRLEAWDWFQGDAGDNSYAYSGNLFRMLFSQSLENMDWQVELAVPFLLGLPDNAVAPGTQGQLGLGASYYLANNRNRNTAMFFPKQGFVRFRNLGGSAAQSVRLGRFEYLDGSEMTPKSATLAALKTNRINQRLLGNFGWAHVGRSFDGVHYAYAKPTGNFTLVAGIPTRGVFQTDGWGQTETAFGYAAYTKPWGKGVHAAETRTFALYYQDWRKILKTDSRPAAARRGDLANIRVWSFGGHHLSAFTTAAGVFDALLWGLGQAGKWGTQDHRASAIAVEGGWQPQFLPRLKPWFRAGYFDGSGDGNPNDGQHNSFFQLLPTPRPFARFPFFDLVNNRDYLASLTLRPYKQVTVSSEFHAMRLSNRNDLWYLGGGVYQPWTFGYVGRAANGASSLANLYDTSVEYRRSKNVTLTGYFGYARGGAVMQTIYPKGKDGKFGYLEMLYRF